MRLAVALSLAIAALILGSAGVLMVQAPRWALAPADLAAVRFTVWQAGLSAGLATLLAIPLARALFRRRFWGRGALIAVLSAPFVLPVVVAVLGILAIFGRAGPINGALAMIGLPSISIFGLHGVVLANVFFNLPLAVRMLLIGWQGIPPERFRLAQSLGLTAWARFYHLEWPMLRGQLGGIFAAIFLICLTSFAVALTLGGGPRASTIELAIYQALRFEFDLGRAAMLAAIQFGLCAVVTVLAFGQDSGLGRGVKLGGHIGGSWVDWPVIALAALFLISPMGAALGRGVVGLTDLPPSIWPALLRSVLVAVAAAALSVAAALILTLAALRARVFEFAAMLPLATSGLVLGTGLFVVLRPVIAPQDIALPLTVLANALLSLPFLFRIFLPEARRIDANYTRLTAALGLTHAQSLRQIILPMMARPLGYGAGLAAALSMGDLGVIALFADQGSATLPLLVQRLMGAYRMDAAASAALVLVCASAALFFTLDWMGRRYAEA